MTAAAKGRILDRSSHGSIDRALGSWRPADGVPFLHRCDRRPGGVRRVQLRAARRLHHPLHRQGRGRGEGKRDARQPAPVHHRRGAGPRHDQGPSRQVGERQPVRPPHRADRPDRRVRRREPRREPRRHALDPRARREGHRQGRDAQARPGPRRPPAGGRQPQDPLERPREGDRRPEGAARRRREVPRRGGRAHHRDHRRVPAVGRGIPQRVRRGEVGARPGPGRPRVALRERVGGPPERDRRPARRAPGARPAHRRPHPEGRGHLDPRPSSMRASSTSIRARERPSSTSARTSASSPA